MLSEPMEREQTHSSSRYGRPPWLFKGSAVYQLHLVKAETARVFIPKEFRLVEAFGYTLGGFFLASYDDSPAGTFDELVVIAGIVWNPPTSCAWAARVLVNSGEACAHGRKAVGLPSQVARFSKTIRPIPKTSKDKRSSFLDKVGAFTSHSPKSCIEVQVSEFKGQTPMNICNINFSAAGLDSSKWMGPLIKMSLPSFSGRTKYNPHLLKYSCQIECRACTSSMEIYRITQEILFCVNLCLLISLSWLCGFCFILLLRHLIKMFFETFAPRLSRSANIQLIKYSKFLQDKESNSGF